MRDGKDTDDGKQFHLKDATLDPDRAWTKELAQQVAERIAQDAQSKDNRDMNNVAASLNRRDNPEATRQVDEQLRTMGFPNLSVETTSGEGIGGSHKTTITNEREKNGETVTDRWSNTAGPYGNHSTHEVNDPRPTGILPHATQDKLAGLN